MHKNVFFTSMNYLHTYFVRYDIPAEGLNSSDIFPRL